MNAKQRLNRLKNYETDVETLNNELIVLKSLVLKGQVLSHDPIRTKRGNKTEELNVSIIDKSDQIYQKLEQLLDERTETVEAIERLGDPHSWLFKGKNSTNARPFSEHYQPC